jgi:hypothetical protein
VSNKITRRVYEIVADEDNGFWMLLEDGIGMARSKSRNVLKRVREALQAVEGAGLVGLTVEEDSAEKPRGVVQAISGNDLIVRLTDDRLDSWNVRDCRLVEPERPDKPTPWNDPAIGIIPAVDLLERVIDFAALDRCGAGMDAIVDDIKKFLKAREDAQPVP